MIICFLFTTSHWQHSCCWQKNWKLSYTFFMYLSEVPIVPFAHAGYVSMSGHISLDHTWTVNRFTAIANTDGPIPAIIWKCDIFEHIFYYKCSWNIYEYLQLRWTRNIMLDIDNLGKGMYENKIKFVSYYQLPFRYVHIGRYHCIRWRARRQVERQRSG